MQMGAINTIITIAIANRCNYANGASSTCNISRIESRYFAVGYIACPVR